MHYGICPLSVIPIRSSSSHKSEMISQLLFGELLEILDRKGKQWVKIRCAYDNFVGWVDASQIKSITPSEFESFTHDFAFSLELVQPVMGPDHFVPITMGARLPSFDGMHFKLGETPYTFSGQAIAPSDISPNPDFILKIAKRYLNTPFLWGGRSPFGVDSAGLVQLVYSMAGIALPREASLQIEEGETVDFVEQAAPGDLAFFENKAGRIAHVGIIMPDRRIIHSYGGVRIDLVDHYGIYHQQDRRYTHRLRLAKRVLPLSRQDRLSRQADQMAQNQQTELFSSPLSRET